MDNDVVIKHVSAAPAYDLMTGCFFFSFEHYSLIEATEDEDVIGGQPSICQRCLACSEFQLELEGLGCRNSGVRSFKWRRTPLTVLTQSLA